MSKPGKLVRDKIPELIRSDGLEPIIHTASPDEVPSPTGSSGQETGREAAILRIPLDHLDQRRLRRGQDHARRGTPPPPPRSSPLRPRIRRLHPARMGPSPHGFQDLPCWRELVIETALALRRHHAQKLLVPMSQPVSRKRHSPSVRTK
jgi:hypothetical protein